MKKLNHVLLLVSICMLYCVAATAGTADQLIGKVLYTQVNMHSLKGKAVTWTNYQVDRLIPVNTEVTIDNVSGSKVIFTIKKTGQQPALLRCTPASQSRSDT